jgi:membrane protease YdiL (CAAX protease family)
MRASLLFVALTYLASWLLWIAAGAAMHGSFSQPAGLGLVGGSLYFAGVFAPALVAIGLTAWSEGRAGAVSLLGRMFVVSVGARWYLFAIAFFPAVKIAVAVTYRLMSGSWPDFIPDAWFVMAAAIVLSTPMQSGEEIGWRGYLLPRLSARLGLPWASLVVGVIWGVWHLPFFLMAGADKSGQSFPAYVLAVTALSVAMAWLYWRTRGSLLLTMLMHAAVNNANLVRTPAPTGAGPFAWHAPLVSWLTVAVLWFSALFFAVAMRGQGRFIEGSLSEP